MPAVRESMGRQLSVERSGRDVESHAVNVGAVRLLGKGASCLVHSEQPAPRMPMSGLKVQRALQWNAGTRGVVHCVQVAGSDHGNDTQQQAYRVLMPLACKPRKGLPVDGS